MSDQIEMIARVAYEANRAWFVANGQPEQPRWDDADEWRKDSVVNGVQFHLDNPKAGASASHENFVSTKAAEGWVYGPETSPLSIPPTHPCMVPFEEMPKMQQIKDTLFLSIVHAIAD